MATNIDPEILRRLRAGEQLPGWGRGQTWRIRDGTTNVGADAEYQDDTQQSGPWMQELGNNRVNLYDPNGAFQYEDQQNDSGKNDIFKFIAGAALMYLGGSALGGLMGGAGSAAAASGMGAAEQIAFLAANGMTDAAIATSFPQLAAAGGLTGVTGGAAGLAGTELFGDLGDGWAAEAAGGGGNEAVAAGMSSADKAALLSNAGYGAGMTGAATGAFDTVLGATGSTGLANLAGSATNALSGNVPWDSLIRYGAPLVGSGIQAYSAGRAADAQLQGVREGNALLKDQYDQTVKRNEPFVTGGLSGFNALLDRLGLSSNKTAEGYGTLGKVPTQQEVMNEPGYAFGAAEGQKAIDRKLNAAGMTYSGPAIKAAGRFGTDYAGTQYGNAFNRNQEAQRTVYNQLSGVATTGLNAANNTGSAGAQYAGRASDNIVGGANASAANALAQGNIWGNAINQGVSSYINPGQSGTPAGYYLDANGNLRKIGT